jgi:hypothetical protein
MHQPTIEWPGKGDSWEIIVSIGLMEFGPRETAVMAVQDGGVASACSSGRVEADCPSFGGAEKRNIHNVTSNLAIHAGSVDPSDTKLCGCHGCRPKCEGRQQYGKGSQHELSPSLVAFECPLELYWLCPQEQEFEANARDRTIGRSDMDRLASVAGRQK